MNSKNLLQKVDGFQQEHKLMGIKIEWGENEEDKEDAQFWEDNWDDDDIEDDFSKQLRAELEKASSQPQPMKM
ncbi:hypothetical protein CLU79DRAFT_760335 [Phycomyces nitens]|nr:hypothetical protein CLU79DRAFT_760335 [Phycomyces nitens]